MCLLIFLHAVYEERLKKRISSRRDWALHLLLLFLFRRINKRIEGNFNEISSIRTTQSCDHECDGIFWKKISFPFEKEEGEQTKQSL